MKVKVIQYNVGYDPKYMQICKLTEQINKKYCQIHGYELQFDYLENKVVEDLYGKFSWECACVYRLQWLYEKLLKQDCDYLVSLDADAAINKPTIKIEDLIDDEHDLFFSKGNEKIYVANSLVSLYQNIVKILNNQSIITTKNYIDIMKQYNLFSDCERLSLGWIFHNEGFFIVKNTPLMRQFFKDCVDVIKYFIYRIVERGRAYDGLIMDFVLLQEKYNKMFIFLPDFAQGGLANSYETKYNIDNTFVLHNYGKALTLDQKIEQFNKVKQNRYWKEYFK